MRRMGVGILGLVLLSGVAGCGVRVVAAPTTTAVSATMPSPLTTQPAPPPVVCSPAGIRFAVTSADAAMGLRVLAFDLVNCGKAPVTVAGYPDVRLFDEDHQPIAVTVERGDGTIATVPAFDNPPGEVTLRPGERARSGLLWRNLVTDVDLDAVVTGHYLEATAVRGAPWQDVPLFIPNNNWTIIDLGTTGKLGVQAWHRS